MNIVIVSDFRGHNPALESSYARAFEELGHKTTRVGLFEVLMGAKPRSLASQLSCTWTRQKYLLQAVDQTNAELVLLIKGVGVLASSVRRWQKQGRKVFNVFPDDVFEGMNATLTSRLLLSQFQQLDGLFVHDRFVIDALRRLSVRASYIAFARDPQLHDPEFAGCCQPDQPEIVFVGNPDEERVRYLRAIADLDLGLWGNWHWANLSADDPLKRCVRGEALMDKSIVNRMHHATITINILRKSQKTAHNMRTFDAPACGACVVSEGSNGIYELMAEGEEIVTFRTPAELRQQCKRLLADRDYAKDIAESGWQRVRNDTYATRAAAIVDFAV